MVENEETPDKIRTDEEMPHFLKEEVQKFCPISALLYHNASEGRTKEYSNSRIECGKNASYVLFNDFIKNTSLARAFFFTWICLMAGCCPVEALQNTVLHNIVSYNIGYVI